MGCRLLEIGELEDVPERDVLHRAAGERRHEGEDSVPAAGSQQRHRREQHVTELWCGVVEADVVDRDVVDRRVAQLDVVDRHVVDGEAREVDVVFVRKAAGGTSGERDVAGRLRPSASWSRSRGRRSRRSSSPTQFENWEVSFEEAPVTVAVITSTRADREPGSRRTAPSPSRGRIRARRPTEAGVGLAFGLNQLVTGRAREELDEVRRVRRHGDGAADGRPSGQPDAESRSGAARSWLPPFRRSIPWPAVVVDRVGDDAVARAASTTTPSMLL